MGLWNWKKKKKEVFDPKINDGSKSTIYARVAINDINDKFSSYPSHGLTAESLAIIFREADQGNVIRQMELFEEMEEKDTHLYSQLQTRKMAVTGLDWEIQPFADSEQDKEIADFVNRQLKNIENFEEIILDLLDAIGKGISVSEIEWGLSQEGYNIIKNIEWVHSKKLFWDSISDSIKICTKQFPAGVELPQNKFIVHKYKARSGHTSRAGILRVCAWMYLFKNYDLKDWVHFCEVYGMPLRLGKYNETATEEDKEQLKRTLVELGTDAAGIIPTSAEIQFVESAKTSSVQLYEDFARYCDEQMSKAIQGQTLTSDSGGGSFAQSKTHDGVRHDLTVADSKSIARTIRRDLITPLVYFNFGNRANIPFFVYDSQEAEETKELSETIKTLVCDLNLKVPTSYIYKKFSIPKPEGEEEILQVARSAITETDQTDQEAYKNKTNQTVNKQSEKQQQVDNIIEISKQQSKKILDEMLKPILNLIDKTESLESLNELLSKPENLKTLYKEIDSESLQDLLEQATYISEMIGRIDDEE